LTVSPIDPLGRRAQPALAARYSLLQLERASRTVEKGRALGIPIDTERTNGVGANVLCLWELTASR